MSKTSKTPARSKRPPPHVSVVAPSQPAKDPVEVFCRVRPLNDDEGESCHEIISDSLIQIAPPENSLAYKAGHRNAVSGRSALNDKDGLVRPFLSGSRLKFGSVHPDVACIYFFVYMV